MKVIIEMNKTGIALLFLMLSWVGFSQTRWAKVGVNTSTGTNYGIVLNNGSWLIAPDFDDISYDDFVFVASNDQGEIFYDTTGRVRLKARFIQDIYNDVFQVKFDGDQCEVSTKDGKRILEAKYHDLLLVDDYLMVRENGKVGIIDKTGKHILPPIYSNIEPREHFFVVYQAEKQGVVSLAGKRILDCAYDYVGGCGDFVQFGGNNAQGIVDTNGTVILPPVYQTVLCQRRFFHVYKDDLEGACDLKGKLVLQPIYEWIGAKGNGMGFLKNGKFGFANVQGKVVHQAIFDQIIEEGGLLVVRKNGLLGILDADGKWVHQPIFSEVETGSGEVTKVKKGNFWGAVDLNGKQIVPCIYEKISNFDEGTAYGIIGVNAYSFDLKHQRKEVLLQVASEIISGERNWVEEGRSGPGVGRAKTELFVFREDQWTIGLKDVANQIIVPCVFQEIKFDAQSEIAVLKDSLWGVYSQEKAAIFPPTFSSIDPFVGFRGSSKWTRDEYDFHFTLMNVPKNFKGTESITYFAQTEAVFLENGGDLNEFIRMNLDYSIEKLTSLDGKSVLVGHIIEKDGEAICFRVEDQKGDALDAEVVDAFKAVFSKMPKWKPAVDGGKTVRVFQVQRIDFTYPSEAELKEWKQANVPEVKKKKKQRKKR